LRDMLEIDDMREINVVHVLLPCLRGHIIVTDLNECRCDSARIAAIHSRGAAASRHRENCAIARRGFRGAVRRFAQSNRWGIAQPQSEMAMHSEHNFGDIVVMTIALFNATGPDR